MAKLNKSKILIMSFIVIISLLQINNAFGGGSKWDKFDKAIRYSASNWLSNDKLLCARKVTYSSRHKDLLSQISKGTFEIHREEFQICSMNIDGTDERVIRSFAKNYKRWGYGVHEEEIMQGVNRINQVVYNPHRSLIAFQTHGSTRAIFIMNLDDTNVEKIVEAGSNPRFSPDGKNLLYSTSRQYVNPKYAHLTDEKSPEVIQAKDAREYYLYENSIWIMDIDTETNTKVTDNGFGAVWHPDGKKILYTSADRPFENRKNYIINVDGTEREEFIRDAAPSDWSSDGTKIIFGRSVYDAKTGLALVTDRGGGKIPNYAFFSPDGRKITGDPLGTGSICVVNSDGTDLNILR